MNRSVACRELDVGLCSGQSVGRPVRIVLTLHDIQQSERAADRNRSRDEILSGKVVIEKNNVLI